MEVWVELNMNFKEFFALQETNNDDYNTNQNDDETCSVYSNVSKKSLEL